jgi:hypothetical protein
MLYEKGPKKEVFPSIHSNLERIFAKGTLTAINWEFSNRLIGPFF